MLKYFLFWFPMILIAVFNGTVRDLWYKKFTGDFTGHQISTISLIILFTIYIAVIIRLYPPASETQSIYIGFLWLLLTLTFEFGFGLYRGNSLSQLLGDYNIIKGRIWILIPIWVTLAPWILFKILK